MLIIIVCLFSGPFLAQIDQGMVEQPGVEIISLGSDYAIGRVDNDLATTFSSDLRVLCEYRPEKTYLWVRLLPGSDINEVGSAGRILLIDGEDLLLETTESNIEKLDLRHLMISRLPHNPIRLARPIQKEIPFVFDPLVQQMVDAVDSTLVMDHVSTLQNDFYSRHSQTSSCSLAVDYIKQHFENLGYDSVYFHKYLSNYAPNVYAVKPGKQDDSTYVICGHTDAVIQTGPIAYGADDNASGTSAVMEAARVMAGYNFKHRVVFIAFTGEEQGLYGSDYWCNAHQNDPMYGALNFDMIAYMDRPDRLDVISDNQSIWLMNFVDSCASYYVSGLEVTTMVDPSARYSDHASFWDIGVAALCHIENPNGWNPYYHTRGDTIGAGFNDLTFAWRNIKLGVASLASLAEPIGPKVEEEKEKPVAGRVFPTVISGVLQIPKGLDVKIFDPSGRVVNHSQHNIPLPAGIYYLQISGERPLMEKVVVLK